MKRKTWIILGLGAAVAYWYWKRQQTLFAVAPGAGAAASSSGAVSGLRGLRGQDFSRPPPKPYTRVNYAAISQPSFIEDGWT